MERKAALIPVWWPWLKNRTVPHATLSYKACRREEQCRPPSGTKLGKLAETRESRSQFYFLVRTQHPWPTWHLSKPWRPAASLLASSKPNTKASGAHPRHDSTAAFISKGSPAQDFRCSYSMTAAGTAPLVGKLSCLTCC